VELRVIGCHGGETPRHRTSAFILDEIIAIDAGSLTSGLEINEQVRLEACLVSHAHLDHIRDLATIADNRCQVDCAPLVVAGTPGTIDILRKHFFNNLLWPDFAEIPDKKHPTIQYVEIVPEKPAIVAGREVRVVYVDHTIESAALIISSDEGSIAYSGDTGPTDRIWEELSKVDDLRGLLMEVSFPNREAALAKVSGHHTPKSMAEDLKKYRAPKDLATLLYHIKPVFQDEVERECAKLKGVSLEVLKIGDQYVF